MDVHSPDRRSYNMSQIKGKDTNPEITVRRLLWLNGYRYRLHRKHLPGKPDIVFPSRNKVIFIHGCFWHKHNCKLFKWPENNAEFWRKKIEGNKKRDQIVYRQLRKMGWKYLVLWECEIKKGNCEKKLRNIYQRSCYNMYHRIDPFTGTTWEEFINNGSTMSGFRESRWKTFQKIKPGDISARLSRYDFGGS